MKAAKWLLPWLTLSALACGDRSVGGAAPTTPSPHYPGIERNLTATAGPSLAKRPTQPALPSPSHYEENEPEEVMGSPGTSRTPRSVDHDLLERQVALRLMP